MSLGGGSGWNAEPSRWGRQPEGKITLSFTQRWAYETPPEPRCHRESRGLSSPAEKKVPFLGCILETKLVSQSLK